MGHLWYVEVVLEVELFVIKDPILGTGSVKKGEFFLHLVDCLKDQQVAGGQVFDLVSKSYVNSSDLLIEGIREEELDIHVVQRCIHVTLIG